jgi:hypothetical protein
MHSSLRPKTNLALIAIFASVMVAGLVASWPSSAIPSSVGVLIGAIVGILQRKSMSAVPDRFRGSQSAMEVRRALTSTASGAWAIKVQWLGAFVLLGIALALSNPLTAFIQGYVSLMLAREIATLRAVEELGTTGA